jgi:hypothetical protein
LLIHSFSFSGGSLRSASKVGCNPRWQLIQASLSEASGVFKCFPLSFTCSGITTRLARKQQVLPDSHRKRFPVKDKD